MKEISINCAGVTDEASLYALFAKSLGISAHDPEALYDSLTAIEQETHLTVFGLGELAFATALQATLQDAEADNFWLNISLQ